MGSITCTSISSVYQAKGGHGEMNEEVTYVVLDDSVGEAAPLALLGVEVDSIGRVAEGGHQHSQQC